MRAKESMICISTSPFVNGLRWKQIIKDTLLPRLLELGSFVRRRSCSVLLLDSWNYPVEVNANDVEGDRSRPGTDSRTIDAKMSHGNLMQGYNCKYNRLTTFSRFASPIKSRIRRAGTASTTWKMSSDNGGFRLFDARQNKPRPEPRIATQRDTSGRSVACRKKFCVKIVSRFIRRMEKVRTLCR